MLCVDLRSKNILLWRSVINFMKFCYFHDCLPVVLRQCRHHHLAMIWCQCWGFTNFLDFMLIRLSSRWEAMSRRLWSHWLSLHLQNVLGTETLRHTTTVFGDQLDLHLAIMIQRCRHLSQRCSIWAVLASPSTALSLVSSSTSELWRPIFSYAGCFLYIWKISEPKLSYMRICNCLNSSTWWSRVASWLFKWDVVD